MVRGIVPLNGGQPAVGCATTRACASISTMVKSLASRTIEENDVRSRKLEASSSSEISRLQAISSAIGSRNAFSWRMSFFSSRSGQRHDHVAKRVDDGGGSRRDDDGRVFLLD